MRTDIHRPSAIIPADYHYVGVESAKMEPGDDFTWLIAERIRIRAHMERTGGTYSHHQHGGNCHVCGAHCIYSVLFHHEPTNSYIRTGMDCAEKLDMCDCSSFRREIRSALEQNAGKRKAKAILEQHGLSRAWEIATFGDLPRKEEKIISEMVAGLIKWGKFSDKQIAFMGKLLHDVEHRPEIEAKRAAEYEAASPLPLTEERAVIIGQVVSVKRPNKFTYEDRMMVVADAGWKIMGKVPSDIFDTVKVGDRVQFNGRIKASRNDPKFGYYSRPTKAAIIAAAQ